MFFFVFISIERKKKDLIWLPIVFLFFFCITTIKQYRVSIYVRSSYQSFSIFHAQKHQNLTVIIIIALFVGNCI